MIGGKQNRKIRPQALEQFPPLKTWFRTPPCSAEVALYLAAALSEGLAPKFSL